MSKFLQGRVWHTVGTQVTINHSTFKVKDGATTPNEITVKVGEGNITYTERRGIEYTLNRGQLDEVRLGDESPMDVSFGMNWEYILNYSTGAAPNVEEALLKRGAASSWTSADTADPCKPYATDLELALDPSCGGTTQTITIPDFRVEQIDHDLRAGTVSASGKANVLNPTVVHT
jgi:hypothetical protein